MNTKEDIIYETSEKAYQDEENRTKYLEEKADKYLGAIGIIIGLQIFQIGDIALFGNPKVVLGSWIAIGAYAALGIALVLVMYSRRVRDYESYPTGEILIDELKEPSINDVEAKIKVAKMYLKAHNNNKTINDDRAKQLSLSTWLIILGFLLTVISYVIVRTA